MNIFDVKLPTKIAAQIAGMNEAGLQGWMRRKEVGTGGQNGIDPVLGGGSQGSHRLWSFRNIMEIAIANELVTGGVDLDLALSAGATFAYTGGMPGNMAVDMNADPDSIDPMREPGFPFHDDHHTALRTFVIVSNKGTTVVAGGDDYDPIREAMIRLGNPKVWTCLDCNEVFWMVCHNLKIVPIVALEQAYGVSAF